MPWRGDTSNPVPNSVQEPIDRSEKLIVDNESVSSFNTTDVGNRAKEVRRDTDTQKSFTISLYDIDETILLHLEQMRLQVEDVGKVVKVPIFFGSPEQWTSAQRDGHIRDKQGKLILPAMILKRTTSEADSTLQFFNRYLSTAVIKLYSDKNKYTKFSALVGQTSPVNDVYNVVVPSHMVLTYHFIVWTELVEQMNKLVQILQFNTKDYWGSKKGFRFRTLIPSFGHTTQLQAGEDRVVKTEFDLTTHGYILPDTMTKLESHQMTFQKMMTPKKIVMGTEVVATGFDLQQLNRNREKWRNPNYPNLQADVPIPAPPVVISDQTIDSSIVSQIQQAMRATTETTSPATLSLSSVIASFPYLHIVPIPSGPTSLGNPGDVSYDENYFYIYSEGAWRTVPIAELV